MTCTSPGKAMAVEVRNQLSRSGSVRAVRWAPGTTCLFSLLGTVVCVLFVAVSTATKMHAQDVTVRDSAGITIISNHAPLWGIGSEWSVDTVPTIDISEVDADSTALYRVRSVFRLDDGRIAVADETQRLLVFDRHGKYILTAGRRGAGPGEFEALALAGRYRGDSIFAVDVGRDVFSVFDSHGQLGRSMRMSPRGVLGGYQPRAVFGDGDMVLTATSLPLGGPPREEFLWSYLIVTDDQLVPRDTLAHFPKTTGENASASVYFAPFAETVVADTLICWAFSDRIAVRFIRRDGKVVRIAHVPFERYRITRRRWDAYVQWRLARFDQRNYPPSVRARAMQEMDRSKHAAQLPAFARMLADGDGNLWLQDYPFAEMRPSNWQVLRHDGRWLGTVGLPTRFDPHDIGRDYILGVWRDELGTEHVRLYRLERKPT